MFRIRDTLPYIEARSDGILRPDFPEFLLVPTQSFVSLSSTANQTKHEKHPDPYII